MKLRLSSRWTYLTVSVPYSNCPSSTSKTSVTLSLVMPSQGGTLTNGTNTASTLEEGTPTHTPGQSPTTTLHSTNNQTTQSSSSSSGDGGSLFRQRGSQAVQPDETGRVPPYVDFTQFYRLWGSDHGDFLGTQGSSAGLGPQ
ncbi:TGF-beta-activated kinase 1 and MAP3K7-binding protein 1-like [Salvelinus namaycush]|uniref:TGF-beta-activated kinase 1 and MAP3K7-binding protein 1-like n=1 Tax=Salvelinus namaycush TaxID=8040 RepID=A0A8U0Q3M4_SALNM|nr:TGF-beta-activated kinase 1 and MAP3K7-binding protein 1-like [Salvelinus namaycush]